MMINTRIPILVPASLLFLSVACGNGGVSPSPFDTVYYAPEYAEGFEIAGFRDSAGRVIRTKSAWQGGDSPVKELFISRNGEKAPEGFEGQVLEGEAERIAAMSSTHIAMLDLLGETSRVKAVSGLRFISNDLVRENRDSIADVGSEADADFEKLAGARPDLVLLYGVNSSSPMEKRLEALGIPYIYIGEYLERNPLGKAEWIVVLGELTGCREAAENLFAELEKRYVSLKESVPDDVRRPSVMLNTPYGDTWFMASPHSSMACLLRDAGARYVFSLDGQDGKTGSGTYVIDSEEAFLLASEADFWLNVGQFRTVGQLVAAYPETASLNCVARRNIYSCDRRTTDGGGSDFWESGSVRPDLVLADLIRIFHPELSDPADTSEQSLVYYFRLE